MRSLIRWGATLGLCASTLAATFLAGAPRAIALTDAEVIERLRSVPVFTIADENGSPLVAAPTGVAEDGSATVTPVTGVFISQEDAEAFLTGLREASPDLGDDVQVVPVSLAEVYQLAVTSQENNLGLEFVFVPMVEEVQSAVTLLEEQGFTVDEFEGVPLFIARSLEGEGGFLTIEAGDIDAGQSTPESFIPIFFEQVQIETMLSRLQQSQPALANTVEIQVINLEGLIETLQTSDNEELNRILLIPPTDSLQYVLENAPAAPAE